MPSMPIIVFLFSGNLSCGLSKTVFVTNHSAETEKGIRDTLARANISLKNHIIVILVHPILKECCLATAVVPGIPLPLANLPLVVPVEMVARGIVWPFLSLGHLLRMAEL